MKILMVNKYFFVKGGSERYYFELSRILENHGHEVIPFAMRHPNNYESRYDNYFVDNIEFNFGSNFQKLKNSIKIISRVVYSFHARKKIEQLINKTKPDIAHLHMIEHQISPSILHSLKKHDIPVILTAHQLKLICPNYRMYNWRTKQICEKCLDGHYYHPFFERCHKNSRSAGLLIGVEAYMHKFMKIYENNVDIIHTPSKFFKRKFIQAGIDPTKIEQLYYTIRVDQYKPLFESGNYFVYFGRLEEAKGLKTLLSAMKNITKSQLLIIGSGDYRENLEILAKQLNLNNVKFLGKKSGNQLKEIVSNSKFVVVPSECYDNSPLVIYESYSMGKPVIGSSLGGIPELIENNKTGLIFESRNVEELSEKINYFLNNPKLLKNFGKNARNKAETEFSPEIHYRKMFEKYNRLVHK